ncbi:hypothetical protein HHL08_15900 [Sphingobium sp. AR-3-1]|uniref:Uncharacterized protein n=1 Tax=Sphingobium psychrophilum TaxID=2728834 RepID=A0A7X9WXC4_9SPHN|nr:hypothetical protein [Sphingobium psychrophilum]NML11614.1 hypothetical protein [Sphingobium psychrophilum]
MDRQDLREQLWRADDAYTRSRNAMDASTFNGRNRTEALLKKVCEIKSALQQGSGQ